jgi:hypothetical protein
MRVFVYPEKTYEEMGAERWEVEWQTVRPSAVKRVEAAEARGDYDEIDMDRDLIYHYRHYSSQAAAMRAARGVVNLGRTEFGCATVVRQVVDWYVEEDRIAEWATAGDVLYVP